MNEDILGIKINKDLQWFKMTLALSQEIIKRQQKENQHLKATNESLNSLVNSCQKEIRELKAESYRLEHNEKVLLQREETAINYIDQVIGYKSCAREIDEELNTLIGILRGGNNE